MPHVVVIKICRMSSSESPDEPEIVSACVYSDLESTDEGLAKAILTQLDERFRVE